MDASALRALMEKALGGSKRDALLFFEELLLADLFIPTTDQSFPMKGVAQPPNIFLDILGIQHKDPDGRDYVVVPCFLSREEATNWAAKEVKLRVFKFKDLSAIVPQSWSLVIEPGGEVEKELTPWELSLLTADPPQLEELVAELFSSSEEELFEVRGVHESEYPELFSTLMEYAEKEEKIQFLSLIRNESTLCLGALVDDTASESQINGFKEALQQILGVALIGSDSFKVAVGRSFNDDPLLLLFKGAYPLFKR